MNTVSERLELLRNIMRIEGISACIIPTSDPHQSEYTADYAKYRAWISGFTGSAGTLVVGQDKAGLWTDSRYFIQAEIELQGSGIDLFKLNTPGTLLLEEWILQQDYGQIGIDGAVFSAKEVLSFQDFWSNTGISLKTDFKPYEQLWINRPPRPKNPFFIFPESQTGESVKSKLAKIRKEMAKEKTDILPIAMLDEIAWCFNLRGSDIAYNPVGICYACISLEEAWLFADSIKITTEVRNWLDVNQIQLLKYDDFPHWLSQLGEKRILLDGAKINYELFGQIPMHCKIMEGTSPAYLLKGNKNSVELMGFRKAMIKDGIALVRFNSWLEETLEALPAELDEFNVGKKIAIFRAQQAHYVCESFSPIVAMNEHGAIVHYEASEKNASKISKNGMLLIDTGGQYLDGTTDITRSFFLGPNAPEAYMHDYTSILKGVIALSTILFPAGTRGVQLDVLARQFLWQQSINFFHGTGHGVGHFLNVHEGPHSIRMNENPTTLEPGMVVSNEPGIYRKDKWGIRLENMLAVCEHSTSEFGTFYAFETLTLFPFERNCILVKELTTQEIDWINNYHQKIFQLLEPELNEKEKLWLKQKTAAIGR